jgi:hypothetical protein
VTASAHGKRQVVLTGEIDGGHDVSHAGTCHDQQRPLVDHGNPDPARALLRRVVGRDDLTAKPSAERFDRRRHNFDGHTVSSQKSQ